ncbi:hypothetical protein NDN08_007639 [Rhodosorus marinus]|uniref:Uncharacterized protein n=1 Tax=Rhodosorus marinus TaxID=101924 RepID=A0AAV8V0Y4_9RHOD|nr:hypothetical protein NDN08_007639 [Rhodosorus marinus]
MCSPRAHRRSKLIYAPSSLRTDLLRRPSYPRGRQPEGVTAGPKKKLLVGSISGDIMEVGVPKEKTKVAP